MNYNINTSTVVSLCSAKKTQCIILTLSFPCSLDVAIHVSSSKQHDKIIFLSKSLRVSLPYIEELILSKKLISN